ncbi:MAG TPA: pentapeptide repeat-containing protein [Pseudolabrys sp.]|jgi:hypothetical protein
MTKWLWTGIAAAVVLSCVLAFSAWTYVQPQTASERKELLLLITQIVGGGALLVSLIFTWWNLNLTQQTAIQNIENARETLRISEDGQVTDRFAKAIDQLGNRERIELRLGAIYTLERISRASEKDYWPIIELMCAFVRSNAPKTERRKSAKPSKDRADIQAAMTMIGRRHDTHSKKEPAPLYLADADLSELHLEGANLEGAVLWNASLEGSVLAQANLRGARLTAASLKNANLTDAHLENAILDGASLDHAILARTHLEGVDLSRVFGLKAEQVKQAYTDGRA